MLDTAGSRLSSARAFLDDALFRDDVVYQLHVSFERVTSAEPTSTGLAGEVEVRVLRLGVSVLFRTSGEAHDRPGTAGFLTLAFSHESMGIEMNSEFKHGPETERFAVMVTIGANEDALLRVTRLGPHFLAGKKLSHSRLRIRGEKRSRLGLLSQSHISGETR